MKNFTDTEKREIIECFEELSEKYEAEVVAMETKGNLTGFVHKINDDCPYCLIALDPTFYDLDYIISLPETNTLKEQKEAIERAVFELTAYDYLATLLEEENVSYALNSNEFGYTVSCDIFSTNDIRYEILLDFCPYKGIVSVEDDEDYITYTLSSGNMSMMKSLIDSTVEDLIDNGDLIIC